MTRDERRRLEVARWLSVGVNVAAALQLADLVGSATSATGGLA
jgi:hypothetical protein